MSLRRAIWEGRLDKIYEAIKSLNDDQKSCPGLILTEEDLRLHLCLRLMKIFDQKSKTGDGLEATEVHAEVAWYDTEGKLTLRPDITVLEPQSLRLLNRIAKDGTTLRRLPSKEYVYDGKGTALLFELKYLRSPKKVNARQVTAIKKDTQKIKDLLEMWNSVSNLTVFAYLVIFSKTDYRDESVEEIVNQFSGSDHRAFYFSGSITPNSIYAMQAAENNSDGAI